MFDFAHPILLYMLLAVPAFFGLYLMARAARRRKLRRFGKAEVISHLMPEVSRYKPAIKITVQLLALAAMIFGTSAALFRDSGPIAAMLGLVAFLALIVCIGFSIVLGQYISVGQGFLYEELKQETESP